MRFFVVGCGSIGRRHLGNLVELGHRDLLAYDPTDDRALSARDAFNARPVDSLEDGFAARPDAVLLCSPTALHLEQAWAAVEAGCHLFIEKPISHVRDGVSELVEEADARGLRILVGCNFRFDRGLRLMKEALEAGEVGRPQSASATFGQYLPDWHPWEDYRQGYSARRELGGGILLDAVHEMDALRWLLGEVESVACFAGRVGDLELDVEDHADLLLRFASGITGRVHVDYLRRQYHRGVEIQGDRGSLVWSFEERELLRYDAASRRTTVTEWRDDPGYSVNQMYLDQLVHFVRVVDGTEVSVQDGWEALRVLDIALTARRSAETARVERLPDPGER